MRLKVEHLSKGRDAPPMWLWSSKAGSTPDDVDRFWQTFLGRFGLEHLPLRETDPGLGPLRDSVLPRRRTAGTWILIVAHTQLRLARPLAADLRRLWEQPATSDRLTPAGSAGG